MVPDDLSEYGYVSEADFVDGTWYGDKRELDQLNPLNGAGLSTSMGIAVLEQYAEGGISEDPGPAAENVPEYFRNARDALEEGVHGDVCVNLGFGPNPPLINCLVADEADPVGKKEDILTSYDEIIAVAEEVVEEDVDTGRLEEQIETAYEINGYLRDQEPDWL